MNPGYSTLPGAEVRPVGQHEVSYYFDNKEKYKMMPEFKDVYADASSNVYGKIDYLLNQIQSNLDISNTR